MALYLSFIWIIFSLSLCCWSLCSLGLLLMTWVFVWKEVSWVLFLSRRMDLLSCLQKLLGKWNLLRRELNLYFLWNLSNISILLLVTLDQHHYNRNTSSKTDISYQHHSLHSITNHVYSPNPPTLFQNHLNEKLLPPLNSFTLTSVNAFQSNLLKVLSIT